MCSSERKFPDLFKTHLTSVSGLLMVPDMANGQFLGQPVCGM